MNLSNYRIVKIGDRYAIRKGFFFHEYYDFCTQGFWWGRSSEHFNDCLTSDHKMIGDFYDQLTIPEEIIRQEIIMKKYSILGALFLAAFLALVAYGLETDCPDTAIYYYCGY